MKIETKFKVNEFVAKKYEDVTVDAIKTTNQIEDEDSIKPGQKLEIPEKTKRDAVKVLQGAQDRRESAGKDPMGLAATALYLACVKNGVSITQRDLAEAAGVTEVTIRNRYKGLKADLTSKANL